MSPEHLEELARIADPDDLWRLSLFDQMDLPLEKRRQLDTGVALRRYADDRRQLLTALAEKRSVLITPYSENASRHSIIDTPAKHARTKP